MKLHDVNATALMLLVWLSSLSVAISDVQNQPTTTFMHAVVMTNTIIAKL